MRRDEPLRLATRGSDLARRQARTVADTLAERRIDVDLVTVETEGDRITDELIHRLGKTGAFVRALDERVIEGDCDAAVHSLKDVPTEFPEDLVVAAVPERAPAGDVLVTPDGSSLADLPAGAVVGTASQRRRAQVLARRPDLTVEPIRGNVDTRLEKLLAPTLQAEHERRLAAEEASQGGEDGAVASDEAADAGADSGTGSDGNDEFDRPVDAWFDDLRELERRALGREVDTEYDAVVLAEAGLRRTGLVHQVAHQRLSTDDHVPAPGQGALAVVATDEDVIRRLRIALNHPRSRVETTTERIVLAEVGGGCIAPIGVHAHLRGAQVEVSAQVFAADGDERVALERDLPANDYAAAARSFAADLVDRGAAELVAAARERDADEGPQGDGP